MVKFSGNLEEAVLLKQCAKCTPIFLFLRKDILPKSLFSLSSKRLHRLGVHLNPDSCRWHVGPLDDVREPQHCRRSQGLDRHHFRQLPGGEDVLQGVGVETLGGPGRRPPHLCLRTVHTITDLVCQNQQACSEQFKSDAENGGKIAICELKDIQVKDLVGCKATKLVHDLSCCQCCWNPLGSLAAKPADYGGDGGHVVNGCSNLIENVDNKKPRDRGAESTAFVRVWLGAASTEGDTPRYGSGARVQEIANAHDGAVSFELKSATADRKRDHKRNYHADTVRHKKVLVVRSKPQAQGGFCHLAIGSHHKV
mmetsp:Transcript_632/g.1978  ORF Transcript_632/g.1978 Transcript_632/m.1978 type:complete len:310 (+) Transcript_632:61-990(+)